MSRVANSRRTRSQSLKTTPRMSQANTLASLNQNSTIDEKKDEQFKRILIDFVGDVEKVITPSGIRFPSGELQTEAFNPLRDEDEAIFLGFMS